MELPLISNCQAIDQVIGWMSNLVTNLPCRWGDPVTPGPAELGSIPGAWRRSWMLGGGRPATDQLRPPGADKQIEAPSSGIGWPCWVSHSRNSTAFLTHAHPFCKDLYLSFLPDSLLLVEWGKNSNTHYNSLSSLRDITTNVFSSCSSMFPFSKTGFTYCRTCAISDILRCSMWYTETWKKNNILADIPCIVNCIISYCYKTNHLYFVNNNN